MRFGAVNIHLGQIFIKITTFLQILKVLLTIYQVHICQKDG